MKKRVKDKSKTVVKSNYTKTGFGVSGLTLAISGIFLIIFAPVISSLFLVLGLIFSIIQQVKNKTKVGKSALIVSIVGVILDIAWIIILFLVISPLIKQALV